MATQKPITGQILTSQEYADARDYKNLYPKVGLETGYTEALVTTNFKSAIGSEYSKSFSIMDKDSKHVVYFCCEGATQQKSMFKGYRYSTLDTSFITEPEPISLTFIRPDENLSYFLNVGTNFVVAVLHAKTAPLTVKRVLIIKTGGSSIWTEWTLGYDVTSIANPQNDFYPNFSLATIGGVDYILKCSRSNNIVITLDVYSAALAKQRSLQVYNAVDDVDFTDRSGLNRTGISELRIGYEGYYSISGFTWNPLTETFYLKFCTWNIGRYPNGNTEGYLATVNVTRALQASWITTGVGATNSLIPSKGFGKLYRAYPDDTWNTIDNGIGFDNTISASDSSITTDEYTGEVHLSSRPTWGTGESSSGSIFSFIKNSPVIAPRQNNARTTNIFRYLNQDGSPYAKGFNARNTFIVGNKIYATGRNALNDTTPLTVDFFPNQFISEVEANDTLKLDPTTINKSPNTPYVTVAATQGFSNLCNTLMPDGVTVRHTSLMPGGNIWEASVSGGNMAWTDTGVLFPAIPAIVEDSPVQYHCQYVWNGYGTFYALIKTPTYYNLIQSTGGPWTIRTRNVGKAHIDSGNAARGDSEYIAYRTGQNTLHSQIGNLYFGFLLPIVSNIVEVTLSGNPNNLEEYYPGNRFRTNKNTIAPNGYKPLNDNGTICFGWNEYFGYYAVMAPLDRSSLRILSSRDIRKVGSDMSEQEWYENSRGYRYEVVIPATSSVGLAAYLAEYPIFIGGYYTKIPQTMVILKANTTSYVYAQRGTGGRDSVSVVTTETRLNNTFSRICLCRIKTDSSSIVESKVYSVDGTGLPDQEGKVNTLLTTNGKTTFWNSPQNNNSVAALLARLTAIENKVG